MIDGLIDAIVRRSEVADAIRRPLRDERVHALQIQSRWKGRAVWAVFAGARAHPLLVVKVDHHKPYQQRLRREHAALERLRHLAAVRGTVPEPVALLSHGQRLTFVQSGLPGIPLASLARARLRPSIRRTRIEQSATLAWLRTLQTSQEPSGEQVVSAAEVLTRLERLVGASEMQSLRRRLDASAPAWDGVAVPRVAGHGDLAAVNCLLDGRAARVIDWEGGMGARPSLVDAVLFLNHYVRAQPGPRHRLLSQDAAFVRAFTGNGWMARTTAQSFAAHVEELGLPRDAAEGLFVATALDIADKLAGAAHTERASVNWRRFLALYAGATGPSPLTVA